MSTGLRQGFNNVAAGFMPALYAPIKGALTSSRRRATSCFCCREFIRTVVGTLPLSTNFFRNPNYREIHNFGNNRQRYHHLSIYKS